MLDVEDQYEHNQTCDELVCCQTCFFHSPSYKDGMPEFVSEDPENGYVCCPNNHKLFPAKCDSCGSKFTSFYRNRNRILCSACSYPVYIFKLPAVKNFDFLGDYFDLERIQRSIKCNSCSNEALQEFQIIPIDEDLISVTCRFCNSEQLIESEVRKNMDQQTRRGTNSRNDEADTDIRDVGIHPPTHSLPREQKPDGTKLESDSDGDQPKATPVVKEKAFLSTARQVAEPVFRSLWSIARKGFDPIAKKALTLVFPDLGPLSSATAHTVIETISMILNSDKKEGKGIEEIVEEVLPFIEKKSLDLIMLLLHQKSLK